MASSRTCCFHLFGRFEATTGQGPIAGLEARKVQELLSYLLLSWKRPTPRSRLADQLWPSVDSGRCRKYLRQTLWQLQRIANHHIDSTKGKFLAVDQEWVAVDPSVDVWVDVIEFERSYDQALRLPDGELTAPRRMSLQQAANLYRGDLLDGWYHDWCLYERDRYRAIYLTVLDRLMADAEATGSWEVGLAYGRRALREDFANERVHERMMRLYCLSGNRTEALRQYTACEAALRDQLGVGPEETTRALYEQIRDLGTAEIVARQSSCGSNRARAANSAADGNGAATSNLPDSSVSLDALRELDRSLSAVRRHLATQIRALELEKEAC